MLESAAIICLTRGAWVRGFDILTIVSLMA